MQTVDGVGRPAFDDLTARARIRDAALRLFAERGVDGATLRAIAAEAGVSPSLVQHHFGSKARLHAVCDAYVLDLLRREASQAVDERRVGDPAFIEASYAGRPLLRRYLVRALMDDSPSGAAIFDEIVRLGEVYLARLSDEYAGGTGSDLRAHAAVFAAMKLGVGVFEDHLMRVLDVRDQAHDGYPRIARAMLDIISPRFVGADLAAEARAGLDRYQQRQRSYG